MVKKGCTAIVAGVTEDPSGGDARIEKPRV